MDLLEFGFTYDTDKNAVQKLKGAMVLKGLLNKNIQIANYSTDIKRIVFTYIAVDPENPLQRKDFKRFSKKSKTLEVALKLDYPEFIKVGKERCMEMLAELYLKGIKEYMAQKGFDNKKFYEDVEDLWIESNLIPKKREEDIEAIKARVVRKLKRVQDKTSVKKLDDLLTKMTKLGKVEVI